MRIFPCFPICEKELKVALAKLVGSMAPLALFQPEGGAVAELPNEHTHEHSRIGSGFSTPSDARTGVAGQGGNAAS